MAEPPFEVVQAGKPAGQLLLHRLSVRVRFRCIQCGKEKTDLTVATTNGDWTQLICNGCYGFLVHAQREQAKEVAEAKRRSRQAKQQAPAQVKLEPLTGSPSQLAGKKGPPSVKRSPTISAGPEPIPMPMSAKPPRAVTKKKQPFIAKKKQSPSAVKPEQPTGLPFQPMSQKERQELFRKLPGVERLPAFFRAAGLAAEFESDGRLWINGRHTLPLERMAKGAGWNVAINEIALRYARNEFSKAVADNAHFSRGLRSFLVPKENGFAFTRYGEWLVLICPAFARTPHHDVIYGNFFTSGPHWDQVTDLLRAAEAQLMAEWRSKQKAKMAAEAAEAAAKAEQRMAAVRRLAHLSDEPVLPVAMGPSHHIPSAIPPRRRVAAQRRIDQLPETLAPELLDACLEASRRIRLERQLNYDRPVVLECDFGELTLLPIAVAGTRLHVPFRLSKGTETITGQLALAESDPLPLLIGDDVADDDATHAWVSVLLGFAAATFIESAGPTGRSESARLSHAASPAPHRRPTVRFVSRERQWWPRYLEPTGRWNPYSGSYVPGHRRRLHDGWTASDEARGRARHVGIVLEPGETWVQPHIRGVPDDIDIRFRWDAPEELRVFLA